MRGLYSTVIKKKREYFKWIYHSVMQSIYLIKFSVKQPKKTISIWRNRVSSWWLYHFTIWSDCLIYNGKILSKTWILTFQHECGNNLVVTIFSGHFVFEFMLQGSRHRRHPNENGRPFWIWICQKSFDNNLCIYTVENGINI